MAHVGDGGKVSQLSSILLYKREDLGENAAIGNSFDGNRKLFAKLCFL